MAKLHIATILKAVSIPPLSSRTDKGGEHSIWMLAGTIGKHFNSIILYATALG